MSSNAVVLIPGDGIGPEVTSAARRVIEAAGVNIHWQIIQAGQTALASGGSALPPELAPAVRETGLALKGPLTTPVGSGFTSVNVRLRRELDLYANLRPVRSLPRVSSRWQDVDLVIIRENTEGLYIGEETWEDQDTVSAVKRVSRQGSRRIARFAFQYAREHNRKSVTVVHKANILKASDGLFLEVARETALDFPEIRFRERIVDALCLDLTINPQGHDVLLCPNLYGDIISDLAAGLVGGLGLVPGANLGDGCAIFEGVHGSAPDIAGKGTANPTALILTGALMLRHLGEFQNARRIETALKRALESGNVLTPDLGGKATTREFTGAVIKHLETVQNTII